MTMTDGPGGRKFGRESSRQRTSGAESEGVA
jgi:hypothetical protein